MSQKTRQEQDSLGKIAVSNSKLWGAQTQRSIKNFKIGNDKMPIEIIHALTIVKMSCAKANQKQKLLSPKIANAISNAAQQILKHKFDDHFPLSVWQTGSGTQTNMNANEVISNYAIKKLKGKSLYIYSLNQFLKCEEIYEIIIVVPKGKLSQIKKL